jgi:hypothetical protein
MSTKRGAALRVLVLVFIMMAALGAVVIRSQWNQESKPYVPYENAGKSLPVLEALAQEHVTFLRVQDWCHAYSDDRERRANTLQMTCTLKDNYQPFDNASEKRFVELKSKLEDLPYEINWIRIAYGPDGALLTADLSVATINPFKRDWLTYDPGYALPKDTPRETVHHRIDADWYYTWEDWN